VDFVKDEMNTDPYQFDARARHVDRYLAASYANIGKMVQARHHAAQVRRHQPDFSAGEWRKVLPCQQDLAEDTQPVWRWRVYKTPRTLAAGSSGGQTGHARVRIGGSPPKFRLDRLFGSASSPAQHQSWGGACAVEQGSSFALRAILVADMVGYSRWLAHQPVATHAAFTHHLRDIFEPAVRAHAGVVIKTTGDGICAIFQQAGYAESCAREIQSRLEGPAVGISPDVELKYRIAVHYGKIMVLPSDVFGIDVNAAMHMHALAPSGGICISGRIFALLDEESKAGYNYLGSKYIKNIEDPIDIYLYKQEPRPPDQLSHAGRIPVVRRRMLSPPPRLGLAELRAHAELESQRVIVNIAQDVLMEILSKFRDLFIVCPIGAQVSQSLSQFGKLREYLRKEMTLEYFVHGSCTVGSGGMTLIVHFEYLPRQELIFSSKVHLDATDLSGIGSKISSECVVPIISHFQRNEAESWDALGRSEDEQAFREAQKLMTQRTLGALDQARRMLVGILERCGEIGSVYVALARAEHTYGQLLGGE
jgi:class 3 adenylate cyclase